MVRISLKNYHEWVQIWRGGGETNEKCSVQKKIVKNKNCFALSLHTETKIVFISSRKGQKLGATLDNFLIVQKMIFD